jgi:hydrogenase maturation protease
LLDAFSQADLGGQVSDRTLIAGLGSDFGDDQAGLLVARRLARDSSGVDVRCLRSPANLLDVLEGVDCLHIVDACRGAGGVGSIVCCRWPAPMLSTLSFAGTHDLDLSSALWLADELLLLPDRVTIWGIEAGVCDGGLLITDAISSEVAAAIDQLVARLRSECCLEAADCA